MFLKFPIQVIQVFFNRIKPNVWIISGKELSNQHELSIAYAGYYTQYKNYITRIAFGACFKEHYIGRVWIWNIRKIIKKVAPECSLAVIELKFIASFFKVTNGVEKFHIYVFGADKHLMDFELPPEVAMKIGIHSAQCLFNND